MTQGRPTIHLPDVNGLDVRQPQVAAERAVQTKADSGPDEITQRDEHHGDEQTPPLWPDHEATKFSKLWEAAQDSFVDKPRKAVEDSNNLVAQMATRMTEMFSDERAKLEDQWERDGDVSAEDLRIVLLRYRHFFGRLLLI